MEMESQRLANQTDYWLVQYQRLLDAKPQFLVDQVSYIFSIIFVSFIVTAVITCFNVFVISFVSVVILCVFISIICIIIIVIIIPSLLTLLSIVLPTDEISILDNI